MAIEGTFTQQASTVSVNSSGYSRKEEIANTISHALGVAAGIIGLILCLIKGQQILSGVQLIGTTIYCVSIIILFSCSTLYHSICSPIWKLRLKIADHCAIYFLIAGTYTPLMLIAIEGIKANVILIAIWSMAFGGILFKILFINRFKKVSVALYLLMGWLCATVMNDLINSMTELGFQLFIFGGILYSFGVIFYVSKCIPYNHAIWHLFVLGGAVSHFLCVYLTLL